jgi:hypothetical protein
MKSVKGSICHTSINQAMNSLRLKNENEQTQAYTIKKKMITFMRSTNVVTADSSNSKPVGWSLIATNVLVSTFHYVCKG